MAKLHNMAENDYGRIGREFCLLMALARARSGGHFTILGFSTHVKAALGTPDLSYEDREWVWSLPGFEDPVEAMMVAREWGDPDGVEEAERPISRARGSDLRCAEIDLPF